MGWAHSSAGRRLAMRDAGLWILATNYEGGSAARAKSLAKKHKNTKLKTFCFPASSEIFLAHEGGLRGASPSLVEVEGAVKGRPLIRPCRPSAHAVTCEAAQFFDLEKILGRIFLCLCVKIFSKRQGSGGDNRHHMMDSSWERAGAHGRELEGLDVHYFLAEYLPIFAILIILLCIWFIREFADRKQFELQHYPSIFFAYFCAISIVSLSPADLALTINGRHHNDEAERRRYLHYGSHDVQMIYEVFVYCCLGLNPILFFQEAYTVSGYYLICDRIVDTIKRIGKTIIAITVFALIMLLILMTSHSYEGEEALRAWLTSVQNVYGLFIIVFLLGYGLVEFPKAMWFAGDVDQQLAQKESSTAIAMKNLEMANMSMVKVIGDVLRTREQFNREGDTDLGDFMDAIVNHCPDKMIGKRNAQGRAVLGAGNKITKASLAALHMRIIKGRANFKAVQGRVERLKQTVRTLQDIQNSRTREDGVGKIAWSLGRPEGSHFEWLWCTQYKNQVCKIGSLLFAGLSFTIVMSEIGMMAKKGSGISWWYTATHNVRSDAASVIFLSLLPLSYITFLCFWSLFRMRLPGMMIMVAGQQSSPKSMSFVARRAVGMAAPLVFLYYGMIFETDKDSYPTEGKCLRHDDNEGYYDAEDDTVPRKCFVAAFTRVYGGMDDSSVVGNFNIFFPTVTFVVLVIQAFNGFNRFFVYIAKPEWQFGEEFCDKDTLEKARQKMEREKKQLERSVKRAQNLKKYERRRSVLEAAAARISGSDPTRGRKEPKGKPNTKEGFLEKQAPKHGMPSTLKNWRQRYFVLDEPGTLKYYAKQPANNSDEPAGSIDLRLALNIQLHSGKHTQTVDDLRIDIDTADRKFKIRSATSQECSEWMDAILAWHDYAIDNLAFHPPDHYIDDDEDDQDPTQMDVINVTPSRESGIGVSSPLHLGISVDVEEGRDSRERASIARRTSIGGSVRPRELEGHLMKKPSRKHFYSKVEGWAERYFCVRPDEHRLVWFKNDFDAGGEPKGSLDLLLVQEIKDHYSAKNPDPTRFDIDMGDYCIRLRAPSPAEADRWKEHLQAWQDWLLMHTERMSYRQTPEMSDG